MCLMVANYVLFSYYAFVLRNFPIYIPSDRLEPPINMNIQWVGILARCKDSFFWVSVEFLGIFLFIASTDPLSPDLFLV